MRRYVKSSPVPIVGGQPSLGRYCAFGQLFASAGQGGEVFRLDRHPTMSVHPSTPMGEADLRAHLRAQGVETIDLIDWRTLENDAASDELDSRVGRCTAQAVLFDVLNEQHLARIGGVLWRRASSEPMLVVGASSVAQAIIAHWQSIGSTHAHGTPMLASPATGPVFVLAGSKSPVTAQQLAFSLDGAAENFEGVRLDLTHKAEDGLDVEAHAQTCAALLERGRSVLAFTGPVSEGGPSREGVAQACGRLLRRVLDLVPAVRRIGIAGGDTSSISVEALGIWAFSFAGMLSPGVSLTRAHADTPRLDGLELMLKGGQMGTVDVFERLLGGAS